MMVVVVVARMPKMLSIGIYDLCYYMIHQTVPCSMAKPLLSHGVRAVTQDGGVGGSKHCGAGSGLRGRGGSSASGSWGVRGATTMGSGVTRILG